MATATAGYSSPPAFSRSSPLSLPRSPDTASPIYPDRAIRPLPQHRLKARLSPAQASKIVYPTEPPPIPAPLINIGGPSGNAQAPSAAERDSAHGHYLHHHPSHPESSAHNHCTCGEDGESGDEEVEFDHPDYRYATPTAVNGAGRVLDNVQRRLMEAARFPNKPPPPGSTASSADGYESFENTSNKKKRKIPLSSASSMHQSQLSAEMASMGISGGVDGAADEGHGRGSLGAQQHYASASVGAVNSGTGISGAGRGRYGRQNGRVDHGVRRPLGSSSMSAVNGYNSRLPSVNGGDVKAGIDAGIENSNTGGIISQAIKSAAEQGPLTPQPKGQENASLLQSATSSASNTTGNSKTQFTFAVESASASKMTDPEWNDVVAGQAAYAAAYGTPPQFRNMPNGHLPGQAGRGMSTQGTQTTPSLRSGNPPMPNSTGRAPPANAQQPPPQQQSPAPPPKPKPRRSRSKEYEVAARQRRLQQEYTNYHHPPSKDNMYICEFCEYEDIFGEPPYALLRMYEAKDRKARKDAAEKQRLLEKARAKSRKGKKGNKKGSQQANHGNGAPGNDRRYDPQAPAHPNGEAEEYYEDDGAYADEYEPMEGEEEDDEAYAHETFSSPPPPPPGERTQPAGARVGQGRSA